MKNGSALIVFRRKKFWPQIICAAVLVAGGGLSCVFGSSQLFVAAIIVAFLGLNEFGRWGYRTNLLLCAAGAVVGSICGVFTWFEMAAVFVLLFTIGGFMLYYRDRLNALLPKLAGLSAELAKGNSLEETAAIANEKLTGAVPDGAIYLVLSDQAGGLYIPEYGGRERMEIPRNGGAVWKAFASGRSFKTEQVDVTRDQPVYRDARSMMSAPLCAGLAKLGVLQLETPAVAAFTDEELALFEMVAFVLAQSLRPFYANDIK